MIRPDGKQFAGSGSAFFSLADDSCGHRSPVVRGTAGLPTHASGPASGSRGDVELVAQVNPVLVENSATRAELGFHAVCRYSLISPASLVRRRIWVAGPGKAMT